MNRILLSTLLFVCIKIGFATEIVYKGEKKNSLSLSEINSLTSKLETDLYTKKGCNVEELVQREYAEVNVTMREENNGTKEVFLRLNDYKNESDENIPILNNDMSNSAINTLKFNWELNNYEIKKEVQWIIFLFIFNSNNYVSVPKKMKLVSTYRDCLLFLKNNIKLLVKKELKGDEYIFIMQRGCTIYMDKYWKLISNLKNNKWFNDEYLVLLRKVASSNLYLTWREIYKVDPARSQWYILRELSQNKFDEILRLLRILIKGKEFDFVKNIVTDYMVQFERYYQQKELERQKSKKEYEKMKNKNGLDTEDGYCTKKYKNRKDGKCKRIDLKIYLPKEMPEMYVYHSHIKTCVLNLTIMSLFQETKVYFYDIFQRTGIYYIFHKKSISVNRRALLRSNQICSLMFELTTRLEKLYHLSFLDEKYKINTSELLDSNYSSGLDLRNITYNGDNDSISGTVLAKKLSFDPYYYSVSSNIDIEKYYTHCLVGFSEEKCITEFEGFVSGYVKENKNLFDNARIDSLGKLETEEDIQMRKAMKADVDHGLFIKNSQMEKEFILKKYKLYDEHIQNIISNSNNVESYKKLSDSSNKIPNYVSFIQILYLNSKLWSMEKLWYKFPVSYSLDLNKSIKEGGNINIRDNKLSKMTIDSVSVCIKVVTILWKNEFLEVNSRKFRVLDSRNNIEFYKESKGISKIYQDYSTIYLICIKTMSQNLIYYRRFLKHIYPSEYENNWKLCKYYDISDDFGNPSISFQYINDNNVYLQSLPNELILPLLNKVVFFSITLSYIFLCISGIGMHIMIFFDI
ncbi:membrane associated plus transmembrane domain or GPI anchor at C-terminus [Cryptosporidium bovis]|uniref:membrane associated plus transmembrane domain or GPI anchor at C-terminus n=1 Tax=Cryptosporidium bovis TaxID=310047 RepID=UPI00351A7849|nr:membrane associated plus transmembrane domain or GPI anchor at C-terminus [Cryptosporidium bovis]